MLKRDQLLKHILLFQQVHLWLVIFLFVKPKWLNNLLILSNTNYQFFNSNLRNIHQYKHLYISTDISSQSSINLINGKLEDGDQNPSERLTIKKTLELWLQIANFFSNLVGIKKIDSCLKTE